VFNAEDTIEDAVRSVFAQEITDWELIIADDGSIDGSYEKLKRIKDPRVRVIYDGKNRGLAYRLNQITELAKFPYIARMDADDMMHPKRLKKQLEYLEREPEKDVVGSAWFAMDGKGSPLGIDGEVFDNSPRAVLSPGFIGHPTVMARASFFLENPYDENYQKSQDHELWCRVYNKTKFGHISTPLLFYRIREKFSLREYLTAGRLLRRSAQKYGPPIAGLPITAMVIAMSHLKCYGYRLGYMMGVENKMVRMRWRRMRPKEKEEARKALERVRATEVSGL